MASNFSFKSFILITILALAATALVCPADQRDDGTGKCAPIADPCADTYKDDGSGVCILQTYPCAMDFHDDGSKTTCIPVNGTCTANFIDDGSGTLCILDCAQGQKDDGQAMCIAIADPCAQGYASDDPELNDNCFACAETYKDDGTGVCVTFVSDCALGYKDNGEGACVMFTEACATGYIPDGDTNENCFACDDANGYRNDGEACSLKTEPCALGFKDDGAGVCVGQFSLCALGFIDDGTGVCVSAGSPCGLGFFANTNGRCIIILDEFILIFILDLRGLFAKCDPTCFSCKLGGQCLACKVGYALHPDTKQCVFCNGCLSCDATKPAECTGCFFPQTLDSASKTCVKVQCTIPGCLLCGIDGSCKIPLFGFSFINGVLTQCKVEDCKSCSTSPDTCDQEGCMDGYVYGKKRSKCLPCATGCKSCKTSDISHCMGCNKGYFMSLIKGKHIAARCFQNCEQCSDASTCLECAEGFVVSQDRKKCEKKCSDNCATCDSTNPDKCLTCFSGGKLDSATGFCSVDLSCNSDKSCSGFAPGYVLYLGVYYQCTVSDSNCISCSYDALDTCTRCLSGFFLKDGACSACTGNCLSCLGDGACSICESGFYLVKEDESPVGMCEACDSTCLTCADRPTICTSCPVDFNLVGSNCVSIYKVTVVVRINIIMAEFINIFDFLISWFIQRVTFYRPQRVFSRHHCVFKNVFEGSTVVETELSMDSPEGVNQVADGLTNDMNSNTQKVGGVDIIGGSAVSSVPSTESSGSNALGIILGIAIPMGVLILIAVIVVLVKVMGRKKEGAFDQKFDDQQRNFSGKQFNSEDKYSEKI